MITRDTSSSGGGMSGAMGAIGGLSIISSMSSKKATKQKKKEFKGIQRVPKITDAVYGIAYIPSDPVPIERLKNINIAGYKVKGKESIGPRNFGDV